MKKFLSIALILVLVFSLACLFAGCEKEELGLKYAQKDPAAYIQKASTRLETKLDVESDLTKLAEALAKQGSITLELEDEAKIEAKIDYDTDKRKASATVSAESDEQTLSFKLWCDENALCLSAPELLGETVYGFAFDSLHEDMKGAAVWTMLGVDYSEIESTIDLILSYLKLFEGDQYQDYVLDVNEIWNNAEHEVTETTTSSGEKAVQIRSRFTSEYFQSVWSKAIDYVMENFDLGALDPDMTEEQREMIEQTLREQFANIKVDEATATHIISNKSGMLVLTRIEVALPGEDYGASGQLKGIMEADLTDLNDIKLSFEMDLGGLTDDIKLEVRIQNNDTKEKTSRKLSVKLNDEELVNASFTYKDKEFRFALTAEDETVAFSGKCELSATKMKLYKMAYEVGGEKEELPIKLTLSTDASVKDAPAYTNIFKMSLGDLAAIFGGMQ